MITGAAGPLPNLNTPVGRGQRPQGTPGETQQRLQQALQHILGIIDNLLLTIRACSLPVYCLHSANPTQRPG